MLMAIPSLQIGGKGEVEDVDMDGDPLQIGGKVEAREAKVDGESIESNC
jgi:hypothetical protein